MATTPANLQSGKAQKPVSPMDEKLITWGDKVFKQDSRNRFAEDREWYQAALFDQLKQWLNIVNNRWAPIQQNKNKPVPMPVTNHFSKTINANANSLGAAIPEMVAIASDSSNVNRRAAEAAENAFPEMDKESGMNEQNPKLAKQTVLWGIGVAKETVDTTQNEQIPQLGMSTANIGSCPVCGYMGVSDQAQPTCPQCGAPMENSEDSEPMIEGMQSFPTGKLCTEIIPIFEVYLPRDCRDPNLAKRVTHRFRKPLPKAKQLYPDVDEFPTDSNRDIPQFYVDSLRSLVMSSGDEKDLVCFTELWCDWDEIEEEVQQAITAEWQNEPSQVIGYEGMTRLEAAQKYGIYFIWVKGVVCAKGENPWDGKKCFTFFMWQKDVASPYPKGLSAELIPLQKRLNQTDSLMLGSLMTNGVGKWIIPNTQTNTTKITGSYNDIVWYDPIGDGKTAPNFILPQPFGAQAVQYRNSIIQDFRDLGYTEGVGTGDASGQKSFRGIAYLGAKQEENLQTQRALWEQGHTLRKELLLIMATKIWDQPRKAKVSGFNGAFGMKSLSGADLTGDFSISVVKGSSQPKTTQEKLQAFQMGLQGGLFNPQDSKTREFAANALGLNELDMTDHLNYVKADRDLEKLKIGVQPFEALSQKFDIYLKNLGDFMLTEEFEEMPPNIQQSMAMYFQYLSDKLAAITQGVPPDPMLMQKQLAGAMAGGPQNPLGAAPGAAQPGQVENAAANQGNALAGLVSNSAGAPA
jgi:rubrerythrin